MGFGGLLLLLAFTGLNALSVLKRIQTRNDSIRQDYLNRDRILQQLRSDLYLSGTYVRDFLLDPDQQGADLHRKELEDVRARIGSMISAYRRMLHPEERQSFEQFANEVGSYFESLTPAIHWDSAQRRRFGYAFMQTSLLPRRMIIVRLADQISRFNQTELEAGNRQVSELFSSFRTNLVGLLIGTLLLGIVLAGGSIYRVLDLERLSAERFKQVLEARTALRELSARLLEVQESERRAISRELHDEIGQAVSALSLAIGNVAAGLAPGTIVESKEQLQDIRRLAEKTVSVVRDMSLLLRPSMLDDLGLIPALEWQAREVSRTHNLRVTVNAGSVSENVPEEHKTCVYRVVQEALRNVTRHANAKTAEVQLSQNRDLLSLTIHDDGQGFVPERNRGLGLLGIEERVTRLNGSFSIESLPGIGTTLKVGLPLGAAG